MSETISQHHYVDSSSAIVFPPRREEAVADLTARAVLQLTDHLRFDAHIKLPTELIMTLETLRDLVK